jgi:hypothetical protein
LQQPPRSATTNQLVPDDGNHPYTVQEADKLLKDLEALLRLDGIAPTTLKTPP